MLRVFEIMAFEHIAGISLNYDKNTCDRQSTCYQTVLRFYIWLKEMFSNSICLGLTEDHGESVAVLISAVFVTREHLDWPKVFYSRSFRALKQSHFSHSICSEIFKLWRWSFFSKCTKFYVDCKNAIKIGEVL